MNAKNHFDERINTASVLLQNAGYVLVGAGAGLSAAAGLAYSGKRFENNFGDFIDRYNLTDMYMAGFYPFETEEEKWAYWARHIFVNRYEPPATELYERLFELMKEKQYFVITTNVDHQFWKAGFPDEKVFAAQGDYGAIQCAKGCHHKTYDNEAIVVEMMRQTKDCRIPSSLVPVCPVCGGTMDVNLRKNDFFVQDEAWYRAYERYQSFLKKSERKSLILLELGVGYNTPGIIRYPFEQLAYHNHKVSILRLNKDYPDGAVPNEKKTISFAEDMRTVMIALSV